MNRIASSAGVVGQGSINTIGITVGQAAQVFFDTAHRAMGLSIGVVSRDQIRTYHFGTVAVDRNEQPTDNTIYAIASITKTFTGTLLARAVLDGRLALDDDVRIHLDGAYPNLEYGGFPVTLAQLLSHVSGLPNSLPDRPDMYPDHPAYDGDVVAWFECVSTVLSTYTREAFFSDLRTVVLDSIPGTRFRYSNAAAILAGYILEQIYGRSFEAQLDAFICQPLGMLNTGIVLAPDRAVRLAPGYDDASRVMPPVPDGYGAAGALKSTVDDLALYAQWHTDESDPVVHLSHMPTHPNTMDPDNRYSVGLNWQMLRSTEGLRRIWQDGNVPGYSSRIVVYPDLGVGIVVLANELDRSIPALIDQVADTILKALDERTFSMLEAL